MISALDPMEEPSCADGPFEDSSVRSHSLITIGKLVKFLLILPVYVMSLNLV